MAASVLRSPLRRLIAVGCLAGVAALSPVAGAVDSSVNAALRYWRAWSIMTPEVRAPVADLPPAIGEAGFSMPDGVKRSVLSAEGQQAIGLLMHAASLPECDFGIDWEKGPMALMTHLGPMRESAKLLAADARLKLDEGRIDDAVARLAAGYRLAGHASERAAFIGSLVGVACMTPIDSVAGHAAARNMLDDEAKRTLREAISTIDAKDPFGVRGAVADEQRLTVGWLRGLLAGERGKERAREALAHLEIPDLAALVDDPGFDSYIQLLDAYYTHALEAWDAPDAQEKLRELGGRCEKGLYGPLAQGLGVSFARAHNAWKQAGERLNAALARVAP